MPWCKVTFDTVLQKYRDISYSERDKGSRFEELVSRYLMTDPVYSNQLQWARTWMNFPGRIDFGGKDTGIDIVAKTKDGEYWAVQCKCYAEDHTVSKADMDTFLSTSGRMFHDDDGNEVSFSLRLIVATTDNWGSNALEVTSNQTIPVSVVGLSVLRGAPVDWDEIEKGVHGADARTEKHQLRPHQKEALDAALEHYKSHDRGTMIMACGTGKTFTSLRIAEEILKRDVPSNQGHPGCVLFLAPSISLVGQTLREWVANAETEINAICVCSDTTVNKKHSEDDIGERVEDLGLPATTKADVIASRAVSENITVVFSTYQSIDAVIAARDQGLPEFDLIICDEAHRTTGVIVDKQDESSFTKVHDNSLVRGKKRLYMTATPRLYGERGKADAKKASVVLCSMDDESQYGKEFYNLNFGRAVEMDLLSDYKVLILTTTASNVPEIIKRHWADATGEIDVDANCKIWGSLNALAKNVAYDTTLKNTDPAPMRSAVSFSRSISASKILCNRFNKLANDPMSPLPATMRHIDGSMSAMTRDGMLTWLKDGSKRCHILSNVRCLSEGVDVPALDAVIFMDSKGSPIDIVQSVGRVMRKAEDKKYGYIIIPIVVPEDEDPETALDNNDHYKIVWQVLRALRSHDERLEAEINTFNYNKQGNDHIHVVGPGPTEGFFPPTTGQYTLEDFENALYARLVLKVGDREYIENWAKKVAEITPTLTEKLTLICQHEEHGYKQYKAPFNRYLKGLRECVNDNVSEQQAIDMLAQQIITKPIFEKLFAKDGGFVMQNSVSGYIDKMLAEIDAKDGLKDIQKQLDEFYRSVKLTLNGIDTTEGKQKVITALYEKFFKNAFPRDQAINGVVYTPQEIVDFIIHSCAGTLKEEFGMDINDEGVNVLDPFTGTGTFIARLMESGLITKENLFRKYQYELFANEITLLAYYIATVNIENTFARITGTNTYIPFENILLTDTFNIDSICNQTTVQTNLAGEEYFVKNKARIRKEHDKPITIIMGNPPYGAAQKSANDNAKKRTYRSGIDARIKETYLNEKSTTGGAGYINSVYDNYVRAFRWATDRIGDNDGVIAFVTPSGWLTSGAFEGFRRCIESEFSKIYIFNLRGDQNGGDWKQQGEKVFGEGSKVGIAITMLIKHKGRSGKAKILYYNVADGLKRKEKLDLLTSNVSFISQELSEQLSTISPKPNGDWIVNRNEMFKSLTPLASGVNEKFEKNKNDSVFVGYSLGYCTNRDRWCYNFSESRLRDNMVSMCSEYNAQTEAKIIVRDSTKIAWSDDLEQKSGKGMHLDFDSKLMCVASYRPFSKRFFSSDANFISRTYQMPRTYPSGADNLTICVSGIGVKKDFSCLVTNIPTDLEIVGKSQCFPLYWYEDSNGFRKNDKQKTLFDESVPLRRHDGISDYALNQARSKYGPGVTKEDIFYYVYGYLHSPDYREAFADDLRLSLPRIGFVDSPEGFKAFSEAGRKLADLHLNYEKAEPCDSIRIDADVPVEKLLSDESLLRVTKMKLEPDKRRLVYNRHVVIEDIPENAFRYVVNGRSALGWIVDQYQMSTDKESGIVNDPNEYARPKYIFDLVQSVITISVETMEIVNNLPRLSFSKED